MHTTSQQASELLELVVAQALHRDPNAESNDEENDCNVRRVVDEHHRAQP
jgi:hypothetical protein